MKLLLKLVKKEMIIIFRDRKFLIGQLVAPLILLFLFNQMISTDMRYVNVAVVAPEQTEHTTAYLKPLMHNDLFRFKGVTSSIEEGMTLLRRSKVHALVVLTKDFDQKLEDDYNVSGSAAVHIITDNSNTVIGATATYYISSALKQSSLSDLISVKMMYNPGLLSLYQFGVGGYGFVVVFMVIIAAAASMVREKAHHSIDAVVLSSVSTRMLLMGKFFTFLLYSCITSTLFIIIAHFIVGIPFNCSPALFALVTVILILTSLFLGLFISMSSATEANATSTAILVVCMPIMFFSGLLFPISSMPAWAQYIGDVIYAKWYIDAARKLLLQGVDITFVAKEILFMLASMIIFMVMCFYKLREDRWLH